eukprot:gene18408-54656_t
MPLPTTKTSSVKVNPHLQTPPGMAVNRLSFKTGFKAGYHDELARKSCGHKFDPSGPPPHVVRDADAAAAAAAAARAAAPPAIAAGPGGVERRPSDYGPAARLRTRAGHGRDGWREQQRRLSDPPRCAAREG